MSTIKVMAFEPGRPSAVISLPDEIEDFCDYVGGDLATISMEHDLILICNRNTHRRHKPNRFLSIVDDIGKHYVETIKGNFFICRSVNDKVVSINDIDAARIRKWESNGTIDICK